MFEDICSDWLLKSSCWLFVIGRRMASLFPEGDPHLPRLAKLPIETLERLVVVRYEPDSHSGNCMIQWIIMDWKEKSQNRKPWFLPSNIGLSCKVSLKPIHWMMMHLQSLGSAWAPEQEPRYISLRTSATEHFEWSIYDNPGWCITESLLHLDSFVLISPFVGVNSSRFIFLDWRHVIIPTGRTRSAWSPEHPPLHYKARPGVYCASCCGLVDLCFLATEFSSIWVKTEECLAMALSEDGKFRPITIFLYLNELPDNCGVSRACVTSWINALF